MVMMIMMNKNFNCFVLGAGRYLQASGQLVCLANARLIIPAAATGGALLFGILHQLGKLQRKKEKKNHLQGKLQHELLAF